MELILMGVVHRDPRGKRRLERMLHWLKPDAVSVELSPLGLMWREGEGRRVRRRLDRLTLNLPPEKRGHHQIRLLRAALGVPFEYEAARSYALERGIPLHLVDINWTSRNHLLLFEREILTPSNLKRLTSREDRPLHLVVRGEYGKAEHWLRCSFVWGLKGRWDGLDDRRERFMACRLRSLCRRYSRLVHVGGWMHLIHDPERRTLFCRLQDLFPRRILLTGLEVPPFFSRHT